MRVKRTGQEETLLSTGGTKQERHNKTMSDETRQTSCCVSKKRKRKRQEKERRATAPHEDAVDAAKTSISSSPHSHPSTRIPFAVLLPPAFQAQPTLAVIPRLRPGGLYQLWFRACYRALDQNWSLSGWP